MQEVSSQKPTGKNYTNISDCPEPFAKWFCLNGATCFSVNIQNSTIYNCWCPRGFYGSRCDYKYTTAAERYQEEEVEGEVVDSSIETKVNATSSDFGQDDQVAFIITVGQHSNINTKSDTFGLTTSRRYTRGINWYILQALIVLLAIALVILIIRYVKRKLLPNQIGLPMDISNILANPNPNWISQRHQINKNGPINHDRYHESLRLDMIKRESQSRHHLKQSLRVQSFEPPPLDTRIYHNRHHYCQSHQTMTDQISDNTTVDLNQISLMNFDHQPRY